MKRVMVFRILIGLVLISLIVFPLSGLFNTAAIAQDGETESIPPGEGPGIEDTWVPPDITINPDGSPIADIAELPPVVEASEVQMHPSGIIGLHPDQEVPLKTTSGDVQPQGLEFPGDGLTSETSSMQLDSGEISLDSVVENVELTAVFYPGRGFLQNSIGDTIAGQVSLIDAPVLNQNAAKSFIATPVLNPGDITTPYHNHPMGAYYSSLFSRWSVFNEDSVAMVSGPAFNVFTPAVSSTSFTHTALVGNVSNNLTRLDHAATNALPNAYVFALPVFNPGGVTAGDGYYPHRVGVYYEPSSTRWGIYNEDELNVSLNSAFFVYVANPASDVVYKHITTSGNVTANYTILDHPMLNGNPNAVVNVQHIWTNTYLNETVGVWYSPSRGRWTIYNNSSTLMKTGQAFNVLIVPNKSDTFVYKALASRILPDINDHVLRIDHSLLDGNPNAQVYVTHNWNPQGDANHIIDIHPLGVLYAQGHWNIYHTDFEAIPVGATYNVYINYPQLNAYSVESWAVNTVVSTTTLNHPALNSKSAGVFIETQNFNPGEGVYGWTYGYSTEAYYSGGRWSIRRAAGPEFKADVNFHQGFNVLIPDRNRFIHIRTDGNSPISYDTCIDNPLTNNRPDAVVFVTANDTPLGITVPAEDSTLGVFYFVTWNKWCIYTEDLSAIASNTAFNVFVGDAKLFLPIVVR